MRQKQPRKRKRDHRHRMQARRLRRLHEDGYPDVIEVDDCKREIERYICESHIPVRVAREAIVEVLSDLDDQAAKNSVSWIEETRNE